MVVSRSGTPLLSLIEAKNYLNVDVSFTLDDALIESLIVSARDLIESTVRVVLEAGTWRKRRYGLVEYDSDGCPYDTLELGIRPVRSITSITYKDELGSVVALDTALYHLDYTYPEPRIRYVDVSALPEIDKSHYVKIEMEVGPEADEDVNAFFGQAMRYLVTQFYSERDNPTASKQRIVERYLTNNFRIPIVSAQ